MNYISKLFLVMLFLLLSCSNDKEGDARKLINYFMSNAEQLEQFKQIQIVPRGEDSFIYGIDSIHLGLYLIGFNSNNESELKVSHLPDSLLLERGINDKSNFKATILKSAYKNLCIMEKLKIRAVNNCQLKEDCCIEFILQNETVVNYFCSEVKSNKQIKKRYGYDNEIVGKNWTYSLKVAN